MIQALTLSPAQRQRLAIRAQAERSRRVAAMSTDFHAYVRGAWPIVEPQVPFVDGKHIREIARHLQHWATCDEAAPDAMVDLLINVPPGHMKSLLLCVFLPTWAWGPAGMPWSRWLFASFSGALVSRDAGRRRDLMNSDWFQGNWPLRWKPDARRLLRYENEAGGWIYGTTCPKGQGTGEHPDFLAVDDAHNTMEDVNQRSLQAVRDWWGKVIASRSQTRGIRRCVLGQRVAFNDLPGLLIESGHFAHICLPLRFDPSVRERLKVKATPLGFTDFRATPGELLWPEGISEAKIREMVQFMGPDTEAAQCQQIPPQQTKNVKWPADYFESADLWFDAWPSASDAQFTVIALDPSLGKNEKSDFAAWTVVTLTSDGTIYVDATIKRAPPNELVETSLDLYARHTPISLVVEGNGFQSVLEPYFQAEAKSRGITIPIVMVNHSTDKVQRIVRGLSAPLKERLFRFKSGSPGAVLLFEQLRTFQGVHDDGPDSLEMGVSELRRLWSQRWESEDSDAG